LQTDGRFSESCDCKTLFRVTFARRKNFQSRRHRAAPRADKFKSIIALSQGRHDATSRRCNRRRETGCRGRSSSISSFETSHLTARRFSSVSQRLGEGEREKGSERFSHPIFETHKIRPIRLPIYTATSPVTTTVDDADADAARLSPPCLSSRSHSLSFFRFKRL